MSAERSDMLSVDLFHLPSLQRGAKFLGYFHLPSLRHGACREQEHGAHKIVSAELLSD